MGPWRCIRAVNAVRSWPATNHCMRSWSEASWARPETARLRRCHRRGLIRLFSIPCPLPDPDQRLTYLLPSEVQTADDFFNFPNLLAKAPPRPARIRKKIELILAHLPPKLPTIQGYPR